VIWKPARWSLLWKALGVALSAWLRCPKWEVGAYGTHTMMYCVYPRGHWRRTCLSAVDHRGRDCPQGHKFFGREI
jgi:hypothetical protein